MLKYYKNFILCGDIDFFCLLCEESFELIDEVEKHIRWEQHRKHIKGLAYMPKFTKDCIYKFSYGYYCELCNCVLSSFSEIKDHVKLENHESFKTKPKFVHKEIRVKKEVDFVKVANITVSKKEWHGIVNQMCLFCNESAVNFNKHIVMPKHVINLIQGTLRLEKNDWIYRKINAETYYCFKCKKTVLEKNLADHWNSDEHSAKNVENGGKLKHLYNLDKDNESVTCNLCMETLPLAFSPLYSHRKIHVENKEWEYNPKEDHEQAFMSLHYQDKGKLRSVLKEFGKDNFIKLVEGGGKGYCSICNTYISAHIQCFKQHVNGVRHTNHMELKGLIKKTKKSEKPKYKTKTTLQLMKEEKILLVEVAGIFAIYPALGIDMQSFNMMSDDNPAKKFICFLCDKVCTSLDEHLITDLEHKLKLMSVPVVKIENSGLAEFVREIRPGLYHCGPCNNIFAGWSVMDKHIYNMTHKMAKMRCFELLKGIAKTNGYSSMDSGSSDDASDDYFNESSSYSDDLD